MKNRIVVLALVCLITLSIMRYFFQESNRQRLVFKADDQINNSKSLTVLNSTNKRVNYRFKTRPKKGCLKPNYGNEYKASDLPVILLWGHPWGLTSEGFQPGLLRSGCQVTYNQSTLTQAVAVVFHFTSLDNDPYPLTYKRDPSQIFVWHCQESPYNLKHVAKKDLSKFENNFINWTMTYRSDSEIFLPRVRSKFLYQKLNGGKKKVDWLMSKKKKQVLWVPNQRGKNLTALFQKQIRYAEDLAKSGVDVHVARRSNSTSITEWAATPDYKFYMAFEDAEYCKDYMTSQFWDFGIIHNRVPIVWGASKNDVTGIAPPDSFIHVDDFKNAEHLGKYLLYLDRNNFAYRKYFSWMEKPSFRTKSFARIYKNVGLDLLCQEVLNNKITKSIPSIEEYYFDTTEDMCLL